MNRPDPALDRALSEGWSSACRLYEHLARGGTLVPLPPSTLRMPPDELQFGDAILGYARFYGMDVSYRESSSFWFGSPTFVLAGLAADSIATSAARSRAQAMAATQWRDQAYVRTALTNKRLMCDYMGSWLNFWHEGVMEFIVDLRSWAFVLRYEQGSPLMLHGPAAPWFAVATAALIYGPRGLQLPAFAPIAQATAQRLRAISGEIVAAEQAGSVPASGPPNQASGPPLPFANPPASTPPASDVPNER